VATFGMLLRNSEFKGNASYAAVLETAAAARGVDKHGLRVEFLTLVEAAQRLAGERVGLLPAAWQIDQRHDAHVPPLAPTIEPYRPGQQSLAGTSISVSNQWGASLPVTHIFLLGIFAGVAAAVGAIAIGVRLAAWKAATQASHCRDHWALPSRTAKAHVPAGK
jgi:hypothetical protein